MLGEYEEGGKCRRNRCHLAWIGRSALVREAHFSLNRDYTSVGQSYGGEESTKRENMEYAGKTAGRQSGGEEKLVENKGRQGKNKMKQRQKRKEREKKDKAKKKEK